MYIRPELLVASRFKAIRIVADLPYWRAKNLIAQALSKIRESFGIGLLTQLDNVANAWWPFVLESLRRPAKASTFTGGDGQSWERLLTSGAMPPRITAAVS